MYKCSRKSSILEVSNTWHFGQTKWPFEDIAPNLSFLLKTSINVFCLWGWIGELLVADFGLFDIPRDLLYTFNGVDSIGIPRQVGGTSVGSILSKACCSSMFSKPSKCLDCLYNSSLSVI